jgi:SAM-dependent methyltransferase
MVCPLCESSNRSLIKLIDTEKLITAWDEAYKIELGSEIGKQKTIQLFKCLTCKLQYFDPTTLAGSRHLYAQLEKIQWYYMPEKWEYEQALSMLSGYRKILEIGSGFGEFIKLVLAKRHLTIEGIELNRSAVRKAKRRGLPVQHMDLKLAAEKFAGQYDVVCSFQVLEHVQDPKAFLKASCQLLKKGGRLILGLPNADSFLKYQLNLLDMPPHHITRWSVKVLFQLPYFFPLNPIELKFEPLAEYHVNCYIDAYMSALKKHRIFQLFLPQKLNKLISLILRRTGIRKVLKGQSMLVSYLRV